MSKSMPAIPTEAKDKDEEETGSRLISSVSSGRVHFPDSQITPEHAGEIVVAFDDDKKTTGEAHLGFLQERKKYEVSLNIPVLLGDKIRVENTNGHVHVEESHPTKGGHNFTIQIEALQDKLINDRLRIVNISNDEESFMLILTAKVLGKGQGTPLLKHGIKCIGVEDGDSDTESAVAGTRRRRSSTRSNPKHCAVHSTHERGDS